MSELNIDLNLINRSTGLREYLALHPDEVLRFKLLGHGEYNLNYTFDHPRTGEKLVLRIPMGSQMQLKNQVSYEFKALQLLKRSGRTPIPLYMNDAICGLPYGFLVMSYLPGESTPYEAFLLKAASCLAEIHNVEVPLDHHLIVPESPLEAILEECFTMAQRYLDSELAEVEVKACIEALLQQGEAIVKDTMVEGTHSLINTELNSGNFLVTDEKAYLVDWEKPIYGHIGQDLGHFLAPTTTLWKTDTVLDLSDIHQFLEAYCHDSTTYESAAHLWQDTKPYLVMNCLRGITWCAMAYIEYEQPNRPLKDPFTFKKIKAYLTIDFLNQIRKDYFNE